MAVSFISNFQHQYRKLFSAIDEECRAIHRGDYQQVLLQAAIDLGATILTHTEAINVQFSRDEQAIVFLHNGEEMHADVVIGADGERLPLPCTPQLAKKSFGRSMVAHTRNRGGTSCIAE